MRAPRHTPETFVFETAMGYMTLVVQDGVLLQTNFAYPTPVSAINALEPEYRNNIVDDPPLPELVERLQAYLAGERDDFRDIKIDLTGLSPFQRKVVARLRRIGYGKTVSYGELAALAGAPGAARAVGNTMACNHLSIVVPCHRVINSNGALGNYGGPHGIVTKEQLLKLEGLEPKRSASKRKHRGLNRSLAKH